MKYEIRQAAISDLEVLDENIPSSINAPQIEEQQLGHSSFLIAFDGSKPVGRLVVRWDGSKKNEIRTLVPDTPNISMLRTRQDRRGQGVGSSLMEAAENLAKQKGYKKMGLSVAIDNETAKRLYHRIGYQDWEHGTYTQPKRNPSPGEGITQDEIYMIKTLGQK